MGIAFAAATAASPVLAQAEPQALERLGSWHTDPVEASKQAAASGRDVLMLFAREHDARLLADDVGTRLSAESDALKQYELCLLEYPTRSFQDQAASNWYLAWARRYDVLSIPAIVLLDGQGRAYAQLDIDRIDSSRWPIWVNEAHEKREQRDAIVAEAVGLEGPERAAALDRALDLVGAYGMGQYRGWAEEAFRLDADNALGLRTKYGPLLNEAMVDEVIQGEVYPLIEASQFTPARERLETLLAEVEWLSIDQRQKLGGFVGQLLIQEGQPDAALERLQSSIDLAPRSDTADQLRQAIETVESNR